MRFARFVAATALAVAATPVLGGVTAAPAEAAGCTGAGGVTVVVDGTTLPAGGGVDARCVGSGGNADDLFASAGFSMGFHPGQPGYVCTVDGAPTTRCGDDQRAKNYWSLWWSDGSSGWQYSGVGVTGLKVPDGGYVAWTWQNAGSMDRPRIAATDRSAGSGSGSGSSPSAPSNPGSGSGGGAAGSPSGGASRGTAPATTPGGDGAPSSGVPGSATTDPTDGPSGTPTTGATTEAGAPTTEPTAAPTSGAPSAGETLAYDEGATVASEGSSDAADEAAGGSVPWWALGLVAVVLAAGGGGVALARRRRSEAGPLL
ncbi:hypothetical protein QE364_002997 [Nocardioides zeae]|uniref:Uncharacterized protein n=2 Tax=Nocardioides zeae TaxID=1457234 RepID=A0ACC6IKK1_9ACTN|nr:hypothetical protein [Nocardioides zeae]MDQ1105054.1 hypothetical protein [Nocardioides zeae]MDR6175232.1 hypothetical protein [Nocardioides zeae]MDR6211276.1 hypothetical protein [Nocardioides zeae]